MPEAEPLLDARCCTESVNLILDTSDLIMHNQTVITVHPMGEPIDVDNRR
jgi:hypothetical protein